MIGKPKTLDKIKEFLLKVALNVRLITYSSRIELRKLVTKFVYFLFSWSSSSRVISKDNIFFEIDTLSNIRKSQFNLTDLK